MQYHRKTIKVAVVQAAPVLFDREASVLKACRLIREAGKKGAELVLLPEAFIPAYPRGLSFGMVVGKRTDKGRNLFKTYWDNSMEVPGVETDLLSEAAREVKTHVCIGVVEREKKTSGGTLYCTMLFFGSDGAYLGRHRKLKPTGAERLIWGEGEGDDLDVYETPIGRISGLICWENYMPLARMAIYGKGVEIYLAPTADARESWQATMVHIACEGRCYVLGCNQYVTKDMYPRDLDVEEELSREPEVMCRGGSVIVSPFGEVMAGPLYDREGILYAELDMTEVVKGKLDFDVVGHYARPDVFQLLVNDEIKPTVSYASFEGDEDI